MEHLKIIEDISSKLNCYIDPDVAIKEALRVIGIYLNVSRVYIFEQNDYDKFAIYSYEWCNDGISIQLQNTKKMPLSSMPFNYSDKDQYFSCSDINKISNNILKEELLRQSVKSVLLIPLRDKDWNITGFIGFDDCLKNREWNEVEILFLKTASHIISNTFNRLKFEKKLKNAKDFAENLTRTATVMIIGLDMNGKVIIFNRAAEKLTGYNASEVIGKNWFTEINIITKNDLQKLVEVFNHLKTQKTEDYDSVENTIITKEGEIKYILWQNNEIIEDGEVTGTISFGLDISDRIKFEEELIEAKNKAEKSDQMKLEFLANMSHDLRTPMNSIIGFSDLLKSNNISNKEKNDYLNTIISNGKFLMALIDDIIDISKIDSGSLSIENNDFELNKLMEELRLSYFKQVKDKNIDIMIDVDVNKNVIINTDKYRLRQILMNLIGNAIKFTNDGYVRFGYHVINGEQLEIYVEDTGPGIERHYQRTIFERFKQLNPSNKYKGAGLGLSITKSLVELLGFGDIKVISELEKGSKFYFTIPYTVKHYNYINDIRAKKKARKLNFIGKNILIVEDDADSTTIMKSYLSDTNANIFYINDGAKVINFIRQNTIHIVILDIGLPNKNGYEILSEIRQFDDRLPVIVESALAMPDKKSKAFALGCDDFLSKPFGKDEFLNKIDNLI